MNNLFLNRYPYTDFHELNLSWLIEMLSQVEKTLNDFVSINALKYADPIQWDITRQYEKNTIVIDPLSGTAYISVQPVPSGVALTNTDYWTVVFDLGSFVVRASKNFAAKYEADTTETATFSSSVNDWLIWGDVLYKVISPIVAGDQYVVGSNIQHFTMEELVGHLEDLKTTDKSSVVAAINDVIDTIIGNLTTLLTPNTTSVVSSINSFVRSTREIVINVKDFGALGNGVHDDIDAIDAAIDYLKPEGGTIYFPAGTYVISRPIHIGDGTARTTLGTNLSTDSSYNSIKFIGDGCNRVGLPRVTQIEPLNNIDAIIFVDGRISNVEVSNMILWCNGLANYGLYMCAGLHCKYNDIYIYNPLTAGLVVMGGSLPTGNYNIFNSFERVHVVLNTSNTIALLMDGVIVRDNVPVNNDTWLTSFIDCRFDGGAGITGTKMGVFKFVDNITFIRCHFVSYAADAIGVEFNALSSAPSNPFPQGLSFIDCSIKNYSVVEDIPNNLRIGKQYLLGAGVNDLEQLPRNEKIFGFDANGRMIGGFGCSKIDTYDELISAIELLPNGYAINVMCSASFVNTYIGYAAYCAGYAQRLNDTVLQLNLIGNEGEFFVIFDLSTATRIAWGKVGTRPNLSAIDEFSAICALLHDGDSVPCSVLPSFINAIFGDTVIDVSYAVLQKTSTTLATIYIFNRETRYYISFNPSDNSIIASDKMRSIPYMSFTDAADLRTAITTLTRGNTILFECNAATTNALTGVSTESQGSIIYAGGGAVQVELSNNVGVYFMRMLQSDGSIIQSGSIPFTLNP